jgi:hypothetical protein
MNFVFVSANAKASNAIPKQRVPINGLGGAFATRCRVDV